MKNMYLLLITLVAFSVHAESNSNLENCAKIKSDQDRLACYDALVKSLNPEIPVVKPTTVEKTYDQVSGPTKTVPKQVEDTQKLENTEDLFGKPTVEIQTIEQLDSYLVGNFRGWKKGDILELKNGQKWKVVSSPRGYVNLTDPKVSIKKGMFGDFNMKVEGLNARAKVKRIK